MPAVSAQLNDFIMPSAPRAAAKPGPSRPWFARLANALVEARARQAEREVARYIEQHGGRFTDDLERQIERYFV
ncbi:hypothetical protein [Enterovirga aerilata]|uniref:Uncharacterized protein n=1 Tax=Enterovirga aerilata TaxID=2730920 RepID=A0A849IEX0_9HYPH|nr:hypothetical protein [Enterovirga sp. DB1703]NNM74517.1 hypothetical protein [Enterovirga sp. DB1703]